MAYKRKLEALNYKKIDDFNVFSDDDFRALVVFLEDQNIRHYPIEDRGPIRKISSPEWEEAFQNYLNAVACPCTDREEILDWLLGLAVRLEYGDKVDEYKDITAESLDEEESNEPQVRIKRFKDKLDNYFSVSECSFFF